MHHSASPVAETIGKGIYSKMRRNYRFVVLRNLLYLQYTIGYALSFCELEVNTKFSIYRYLILRFLEF